MRRVRISAKAYDAALAFVNARRKEKGKKPIKRLPAGKPHDARSCPCASACDAIVETRRWCDGGDWIFTPNPQGLFDFVREFDAHGHLDAERQPTLLPVRGARRG